MAKLSCHQGWFIFTTILLFATLRSTVAFFSLFFTLDLAFLLLGIGYLNPVAGTPNPSVIKAGGVFGLLAAFLAWYNALAGILDDSNRFVAIVARLFCWCAPGLSFCLLICGFFLASSLFQSPISRGVSRVRLGRRR